MLFGLKQPGGIITWPPSVPVKMMAAAIALHWGQKETRFPLLNSLVMLQSSTFVFHIQVLYIGGAVGGAFLSSSMSGTFGTAMGVSAISGFTGAFIMVFGSRLAGGCTR